jgi:hypothetical protein
MRLVLCFFAIALLLSISVVSASRLASGVTGQGSAKVGGVRERNSINEVSYRSPGKLHKAVVPSDDRNTLARAMAAGAVEISDYGNFKLLAMDETALEEAEAQRGVGDVVSITSAPLRLGSSAFSVRDDLNLLLLRSGAIDTTGDEAAGTFVGMGRPAASFGLQSVSSSSSQGSATGVGPGLRLIQFVGPVKRDWLDQLEASGFEVVAYVPNNAYLVRGDSNARARLMNRNQNAESRGEGFVQWDGDFLEEHKIHPALNKAISEGAGELTVAVQLALGSREPNARDNAEVKQARAASHAIIDAYGVLNLTNVHEN